MDDFSSDNPYGLMQFHCDFEFSEVCAFCSDNNLDVLEHYINGNNWLAFFTPGDFYLCMWFSDIHNIIYTKFILQVNW